MSSGKFGGWILVAVLAFAALQALAQKDEGPILLPKKQPTEPAGATLLVLCDLACNWKLDGEAKGRIEADGSAKARVELGQHLADAVTGDGFDKVEKEIEIKSVGQTILRIALKPVRDARLEVKPKPPAETSQEVVEPPPQPKKPASQPPVEKQPDRNEDAQLETGPTWTDPATGLIWARKDSGGYVTWQDAADYCRNLRLAGHSDWRLPAMDELQSIYDNPAAQEEHLTESFKHFADKVMSHAHRAGNNSHIKGGLELSGCDGPAYCWAWSNTRANTSGEMWDLYFHSGKRYSYSKNRRAGSSLCVRTPGK